MTEPSMDSYRGRRYNACTAANKLREVIDALPEGPYSQVSQGVGREANVEGLPGSSLQRKQELHNLTSLLLRMILEDNDGHVSPHRLNAF